MRVSTPGHPKGDRLPAQREGTPAGATIRAPVVVLDTNVLLDFWVFDDPGARVLRAAVEQGVLQAMRSTACDAELLDVLTRPEFSLSTGARDALLVRWHACSQIIERVFPAPWACTDSTDQKFVDAAFSTGAALLVSKDRALLKLDRRTRAHGLCIVAPRDAVALFEST